MSGVLTPVTVVDNREPDNESDLPWLHAQALACGRPRYHCSEDGTWSASVKVPTARPGVLAEVSSGFSHPTLSVALREMLRRLR